MTEQPKPTPAPFNIDLNKILPTIAQAYKQFGWALPMLEKWGGFKIPPEIIASLNALSEGRTLSPQEMQQMKETIETMQPAVGEPVLTRYLAEDAWELHQQINPKTGKRWGTRDIAELFTSEGNPCSHATIARWIEMIAEQKKFGKIARLISIGKFMLLTVLPAVIAFIIGKTFF